MDAPGVLRAIEQSISDTLGRRIGPDENFFEAGLTSLTLVRLHEASTRGLCDPFPVTAMFGYPNLRALRRYLLERAAPAQPSAPTGADPRRLGAARRRLRVQMRAQMHGSSGGEWS